MLRIPTMLLLAVLLLLQSDSRGDDFSLHTFERKQLSGSYFSEGVAVGDLNNDGHEDIVYGPLWFAGPDFEVSHEIYKPVPQNRDRYADNFFSWTYDFNNDGWKDILTAGFPGTPAYVYENPGKQGGSEHWTKHEVFDWVSNESPQFTNLVGDERPELVCTRDGFFGYASIDWEKPLSKWTFHPISEQVTAKRFGHGLGVGDINGDGREDIIHSKGWYEQPESKADSSRWLAHPVSFTTAYGGAEMYAYDVDGDGDNDVITSEAAHDFGLSWYEQIQDGEERTFKQHLIMGDHPSLNRYGVLFSELHSVNLTDVDGDGLKDIVTGKTYYSHHQKSPLWDAGAVVYWFRLVRTDDGVDWLPYQADDEAGIGRQLVTADINKDGQLDIITGGMVGAHVLTHKISRVSETDWQQAQPQKYKGKPLPKVDGAVSLRGKKAAINQKTGAVENAIEGESLKLKPSAGTVRIQSMKNFKADRWSGDAQLFWIGGKPGDELQIPLDTQKGNHDLDLVLTCARDYGIVQLSIGDLQLGPPIDLFETNVITTGVLKFEDVKIDTDSSALTIQILGANPKAKKGYMLGIDYLRMTPK